MIDGRATWFGDESYDTQAGKSDYAFAFVRPKGPLDDLRGALLDLVLRPGGHLHFYEEDPARRLELARAVLLLPIDVLVVVRSGPDTLARARALCLRTAVRELHGRMTHLVLESRGGRPDATDARLVSRLHPPSHRIPLDFWLKDSDPILWAPDILAGAALQGLIRGVKDYLELLRAVHRISG